LVVFSVSTGALHIGKAEDRFSARGSAGFIETAFGWKWVVARAKEMASPKG
jgi:hypothetical protein